MALALTKQSTPEMVGISPEVLKRITESGGKIDLPESQVYVRLGAIVFPQPRHVVLQFEIWPSQDAARERKGQPSIRNLHIGPEPRVVAAEVQDSAGNVISPAMVLPTYDEVMGLVGEDTYNAIRSKLYEWAKTWPDFAGSTDA